MAGGGMRDAESMLDQVLVSAADPITASSVEDLLGLADGGAVDGFLAALVDGDVLAGILTLDVLESEGRDLVAFSEQLVTRLREVLVERMSTPTPEARATVAPLAEAARRLTGVDASRSGLGGYRWQLELCLLAAAQDATVRVSGPRGVRPAPQVEAASPSRTTAAPGSAPTAGRTRTAKASPAPPGSPAEAGSGEAPPVATVAAPAPDPASDPAPAASVASPDIVAIRAAWPRVVAAIGANPANRPLVSTCRPLEMRDGFLILGFPEDQAFMRDIADRKRRVLEDGIAAIVGRPVAVRCVVTNLELVEPVDTSEDDLVTQARRIFDGELATVEDID
jgi:hypothetical protein